jgi:hypothetical protein
MDTSDIECYNIVFHGGCRGNFLGALMQCFVDSYPIPISKYGSCHFDKRCGLNYDSTSMIAYSQAQYFSQAPKFKTLRPRYIDQPFIIMDHMVIDYDEFIQVFPKGKTIVVTYTREDLPSLRANLLFKNIVEPIAVMIGHQTLNDYSSVTHTTRKQAMNIWKSFTSEYLPEFKNKMPHPNSLSKEDCLKFIYKELETLNYKVTFPPFEIPEHHKNHIFALPYNKIISDKEYVLDFISNLMNRPISDEVIKSYDRYIEAQQPIYEKTGLI